MKISAMGLGFLGLFLIFITTQVFKFSSDHLHNQVYRTAFHFQPPKNWMNDPNAPMYYKGVYHLFYQYNPYAAVWGNITWGHSVSYDLVNWIHLDHALYPTHPFDINGCWSGSSTFLSNENPVILYTGRDSQDRELQNLAIPKNSSDPFLVNWVKSPHNPLMSPVDGIKPDKFRDPTTAWRGPDGTWRVIVGGEGRAYLYHSDDFVSWTRRETPLHSLPGSGMWECPDFYPVSTESGLDLDESSSVDEFSKYVLKVSTYPVDSYVLGKYDVESDRLTVDSEFEDGGLDFRHDYGKFYASKTFFDSAKKRRILWAWIAETDTEVDSVKRGWAGLQSIPRTILLSESGRQLVQWPVEEIETLRSKNVSLHDKDLKAGSAVKISGITASQADVEVYFELPELEGAELMDPGWGNDARTICGKMTASVKGKVGPFGLLVLASKDLTEQTAVFFRIYRKDDNKFVVLMCSDQSRSSSREGPDKTTYGAFVDIDPLQDKISLRTLVINFVAKIYMA
ncbi:beta-fructofuranosidase, insoluble isoenzyme CWINV1-like [Carica papaya]|uniref:beta-fructofuranosidase, insoluble isoenzyme CWINV1-like n=1 Tax=Carica papaya TaxID=3649 RepID=UPI000B8CE5A4|nr:beta-fructofuranosidase, insoluble isoenzyme CWINV1-like [Carica papaya]